MGTKITASLVLIFAIISSCNSDLEDLTPKSKRELILNQWQFVKLEINDIRVYRVATGFEPPGVNSYWIPWFWFEYNKDGTYEFRTDAFPIELGFKENYQPEYGYWEIDEINSILIHNAGQPYEISYNISQLNDTLFVREYERLIYQSNDPEKWPVGSTSTYRETLEKRKGPCCLSN